MSIDDRVDDKEDHYTVRITVGRDERTVETVRGYQGDIVNSKTYDNDQEAYTVFLRALQFQGFTNGDPDPAKADERGLCPTSKRYIYEVISPGGSSIQRFWNSECKVGTFKGNGQVIRSLFRAQIPAKEYREVVRGTGIQ
jgi:hypothetical protein